MNLQILSMQKEMQSHGTKISYGSQNLKVHSKICVVERKQENGIDKYGFISTWKSE